MRRWALPALLVLCVGAVLLLLLQSSGPASRDRREGRGRGEGTEEEGAPAADPSGHAAALRKGGARDEDPNLLPGPELALRGRVLRDSAPVGGAIVSAMPAYPATDAGSSRWQAQEFEGAPAPIAETRSGDDGRFELRIARRSRVVLSAFRAGSGSASLFLLMPPEGDPPEVTLRLRPGSALEGEVVDPKNEPVPDAEVVLSFRDWTRPPVDRGARTDERGRFAFADVADGGHRLSVRSPRHPEARISVSVPAQSFVRVELRAAGIVAGKVVEAGGGPVAGAIVQLTTSDWGRGGAGGFARARTDDLGEYRAEIQPGAVASAVVEHPRLGRLFAGEESFPLPTALLEPNGEIRYDIRLRPGVPVRGRVVLAGTGEPAPGVHVALLRMGRQYRGMGDIASSRSGDDGRFEFPYVTEGTYALEAKSGTAARLVNRYGQPNRPPTVDLYVDGESAPPEQRVELVPVGSVRGRIVGADVEPDPGRRPGVQIDTDAGNLTATVDDLGAFEFAHVPVAEGLVAQSWNPQARSDPFRVQAGQTTEIVLDPTGRGGVTGVIEDERGLPVARARLHLMPHGQIRQDLQNFLDSGWAGATSDESGRFLLSADQWQQDYWRGQRFLVAAQRQGYALGLSDPFTLPEAGKSETVRLVLRAGGVVRGRVEHAGGGPAVNVWVGLAPRPDPNAPFETRGRLTSYTGSDGRFEIRGVGDGAYTASVSHPAGKAQPLEVRAGDTEVRLVLEPALSIGGVVIFEDGRPVANAQVSVIVPKERGETSFRGGTGANGRFRVGQLDAGAYAVEVAPNRQGWGATASFEKKRVEAVAAGTEDLVVKVAEGAGLRGRVEDAQGRPLPGAAVVALPVKLDEREQARAWEQQRPSAVANGRGEFEIRGLDAGEVELVALAEGHVSASQRVQPGAAPVLFRLEPGGVIEGRVLRSDGTPLARHWINVNPASPDLMQRFMDWQNRAGQTWWYVGGSPGSGVQTDGEGRFRFASLPPGEYRLFINTGEEILPPTTLRTGEAPATVRLQRGLTIRGRVTDAEGRPIVLAEPNRVWVNAHQGDTWVMGTSTDADGRFELRGLPAGNVKVQVWAGQEYQMREVDAVAGATDLPIVLERSVPQPPRPGR